MLNNKIKVIGSLVMTNMVLAPLLVVAADATGAVVIENPITAGSLTALLRDILNIVVDIGVPVVIIMIVLAGFKYVTAGGDRGKVEDAHKMFLWTVVGAAIVLGAFVIADIIQATVNSIRG